MFSASVSIDITGIQGLIMDKNAVNYGQKCGQLWTKMRLIMDKNAVKLQNNKLSIDKNSTCQYNFYR
jgi:hypothetical protein